MTPAQHRDAIEALAVLIARWHEAHDQDSAPGRDHHSEPVAA